VNNDDVIMQFHFILNVAVGGNFFPDGCVNERYQKPWSRKSKQQMLSFWQKRDEWYPTWNAHSEDNALQVDYIRVYDLDLSNTGNYHWYQTDETNSINHDFPPF